MLGILLLTLAAPTVRAQIINVKDMPKASGCNNAVGNGTTNDAPVFLCALKYAISLSPANPFGVGLASPQVYAPAGIYNWGGTTVTWNARVNLIGDGPNSTVFHFRDPGKKGGKIALAIEVPTQAGGNPYPVVFRGWALHGPGAYNVGNADTGLAVSGILMQLEDIHIRGFNLGTLLNLGVDPSGFITFDKPYWQFNTQAVLVPSLRGKLVLEQLRFADAQFINCGKVAGCVTFGERTSHGGTDINCQACSFDGAQLRLDRVTLTCVGCHFESVDPYPGVPLVSVGSGKFTWLGGLLAIGVEGASAGVVLSDSNDRGNALATIVGVNAYKAGNPIPFIQLAPGTTINLSIAGTRASGKGFPALIGGYQGGTPDGKAKPTPFLSVLGHDQSGIVSRQGRTIRVIPHAAQMSLDCSLGEVFTIRATSAANSTITAINQFPGQLVVLDVLNDTKGALGTLTFGPGFKVGAFTTPNPGAHRSLILLSDGTNLREIAQTPGDVPD